MSGLGSRLNRRGSVGELRGQLAHVDELLGELLAERSKLVYQLHVTKAAEGMPPKDAAQEACVAMRITGSHNRHGGNYSKETVTKIAQAICGGHQSIASSIRGTADDGDSEGQRN